MAFSDLVERVEASEQALERRHAHSREAWQGLRTSWREGWTPTRIVFAGMLSGFLIGKARPARRIVGLPASRWVQIGTSLWTLGASFRAKDAAKTAATAAGNAGVAAGVAAHTAEAAAAGAPAGATAAATGVVDAAAAAAAAASQRAGTVDGRRRADPQWQTEPRPAEAATELSER